MCVFESPREPSKMRSYARLVLNLGVGLLALFPERMLTPDDRLTAVVARPSSGGSMPLEIHRSATLLPRGTTYYVPLTLSCSAHWRFNERSSPLARSSPSTFGHCCCYSHGHVIEKREGEARAIRMNLKGFRTRETWMGPWNASAVRVPICVLRL